MEADDLKAEIARLHHFNKSDFQTLLRQSKAVKQLNYNIAQIVSRRNWTNKDYQIIYDRWGRGTGKTTSIGGKLVYIAQTMPRSVGIFIAPSYKFLLTRIIPSIVNGLEMHGFHQGLHYFIGEKPPRSWKWEKPYQPPSDFSKFIWFYTGFGMHLISQDVPGDGRGLNIDIEVGDESALLDFAIMEECTTPTLRGSKISEFKDNPLFRKRFHHSSMALTDVGKWVFDLEAKNLMGEKSALIIDASCKVNLHNLADGYLDDARRTSLSDIIFDAEYMNIRPSMAGADGFYSLFKEKVHGYRAQDRAQYAAKDNCQADSDLVQGVPLLIGADFGSAVNFLVVCQHVRSINELRAINEFWVRSQEQKMQDDAFEAFNQYYLPHQGTCNEIFLCYDKTGNVETGNTRKTRAEQAQIYLQERGWTVRLMSVGRKNADHSFKFNLWEKIFQNSLSKLVYRNLPIFRINILRCRILLISIYNSKAKEGRRGEIHKDKTIEAKLLRKNEAEKSTHGSDALDTIPEALFSDILRFGNMGLPDASVR
jgi:hypothetical protein